MHGPDSMVWHDESRVREKGEVASLSAFPIVANNSWIIALQIIQDKVRSGGETGIRTLGARKGTTVFETAPFDHSGTSPSESRYLILLPVVTLHLKNCALSPCT